MTGTTGQLGFRAITGGYWSDFYLDNPMDIIEHQTFKSLAFYVDERRKYCALSTLLHIM